MSADAAHVDWCEIAVGSEPANKRVLMVLRVQEEQKGGFLAESLWQRVSSCKGQCTADEERHCDRAKGRVAR